MRLLAVAAGGLLAVVPLLAVSVGEPLLAVAVGELLLAVAVGELLLAVSVEELLLGGGILSYYILNSNCDQ